MVNNSSRNDERYSMAEIDAVNATGLDDLVGYHLRRAQLAVFQNFASEMRDLAISPGQFGVLQIVSANPGTSQTALGNMVGIERSTVVGVIDKLEDRGLIRRQLSPRDRRTNALSLTDEGTAMLAELNQRVAVHEGHIAEDLSRSERTTLIDLLRRLRVSALRD
jgi:DNA-binding MarR family transcriptional regulator